MIGTSKALPQAPRLEVVDDRDRRPATPAWLLRGFASNERYVERQERSALTAVQQQFGRADATRAALIPVRKSDAWWELTQNDREAIIEERSHLNLARAVAHLATAPKANRVTVALGHGEGYEYPHHDKRGWVDQHRPDEVAGRVYYEPSTHGHEEEVARRMAVRSTKEDQQR